MSSIVGKTAEKQAVIMETDQLCQTATTEVNNPEVDTTLESAEKLAIASGPVKTSQAAKSGKNGSHPKYVKSITTSSQIATFVENAPEVVLTLMSAENPAANKVTAKPCQTAMPGKEFSRPKSAQQSPTPTE